MAHNSIREQIINNVIETIQSIDSIKTVTRSHPTDIKQLKSIPQTAFPRIGISAGLPKIEKYFSSMGGNYSRVNSNLQVLLSFFAYHKDEPDKWLSYYLDEIWAALYVDQSRGGVAVITQLEPDLEDGVFLPYIGFYIIITVNYNHDTKGI